MERECQQNDSFVRGYHQALGGQSFQIAMSELGPHGVLECDAQRCRVRRLGAVVQGGAAGRVEHGE